MRVCIVKGFCFRSYKDGGNNLSENLVRTCLRTVCEPGPVTHHSKQDYGNTKTFIFPFFFLTIFGPLNYAPP